MGGTQLVKRDLRLGLELPYDYEYRRNGTVNLFVFLDAHRPWRRVKVTDRRTNLDFAHCMRDLVDLHYPDAPVVRVVLDNLVIPPFLTGPVCRIHAARFSFCAGVIPPMPIFGRSLLYVQSHFVA